MCRCHMRSSPKVEEFHEGADAAVLGAGYHEGATYYELEDFVRQESYCS